MRYFDNQYLAQYLEQGRDLMVFVDSEYLAIADLSDLDDPIQGVGYDSSGRPHKFNYKDIEVIKSGPYYVDQQTLTQQLDNYEQPDKTPQPPEPKSGGKGKSGPDKPPTDEEPPPGLDESRFARKSQSLSDRVDYWSMIKPATTSPHELTSAIATVKAGEYQGLSGIITEASDVHATIRATNSGDGWVWGSVIAVPLTKITIRS